MIIKLHEYNYSCGDGCCTHFGTSIFVDGVELDGEGVGTAQILKIVLEHLGHEVEIEETFDYGYS